MKKSHCILGSERSCLQTSLLSGKADLALLPLRTAQNLAERLEAARHLWQNQGKREMQITIRYQSRKARSRPESLVSNLE
jgi:hypothetical protein